MKQFFVLALSICSLALFAQIPTNGLIGAWTFSGNANDVSGNGNNGTVNNAVLVPDRCGNPNSAYSFDGSTSSIITQNGGPIGNNPRSVAFWMKTTNTTYTPVAAFDYGLITSGTQCYQIVFNYGCPGFGIDISTHAFINGSGYCINNGAWHHVAIVFAPSIGPTIGDILVYYDGVAQSYFCAPTALSQTIVTDPSKPVTIGKSAHAPDRYFSGALDDIYFYNRILSQQEITQLYNAVTCNLSVAGASTVCNSASKVYSVAPVAGATSYSWTLPNGWTGTSMSNSISVTPGATGGVISVVATSTCGFINSGTKTVIKTGCVGVAEQTFYNKNVQLMPNPSQGIFTLSGIAGFQSLQVVDMLGREILKLEIKSEDLRIDLSDNAPGLYYLKLYHREGEILKKIVKE